MIANVQGNTLDNNNKKKISLITNINEPSLQPNKSSHYGDKAKTYISLPAPCLSTFIMSYSYKTPFISLRTKRTQDVSFMPEGLSYQPRLWSALTLILQIAGRFFLTLLSGLRARPPPYLLSAPDKWRVWRYERGSVCKLIPELHLHKIKD